MTGYKPAGKASFSVSEQDVMRGLRVVVQATSAPRDKIVHPSNKGTYHLTRGQQSGRASRD